MIIGLVALPLAIAGANLSADSSALAVERKFERWERRLRTKIAERNIVPAATLDDPTCNVVVGFTVGKNRRPANAEVVKSSCASFYNRHAQRIVRELGRIGQVPSLSARNHRILISLTYGSASEPAADRRLSHAVEAERQSHFQRNIRIVTALPDTPTIGLRGTE